jgi:hypothetical protein
MRNKIIPLLIAFFLLTLPQTGYTQDRPFLFVITPRDDGIGNGNIHLDAGWGNGGLGFTESKAVDGRVGLEWYLSKRWTALAAFGFGSENELGSSFSGQGELLYSFRQPAKNRLLISAGGGLRFEDDGTVGLAMLATGWHTSSWQFDSNVVLEKADAPGRDPIDLIVSAGWLHDVTPLFSVGVEAVGQDLEGFWEENEAEGGARFLLGPSVHFATEIWQGGVAGGYVFRPTFNDLNSGAERPFHNERWAIQFSLGRNF